MTTFLTGLTLGSILLGGALVVIVVLYLARPFALPEDEAARVDRETIDGLLLRKDALLRDIRELDEDYEAAKVAPEMYRAARPKMVKQAAILMKQLDEAGYADTPTVAVDAQSVDAQIEAAVSRLRTPEQIDAQIEAAIRQTRQQPPAPATNGTTQYCPQCGRRVEPDERFCARCGRKLSEEPQPSQAARA
ncbi:conserved protein of unknown function [Candidatus Promineifilum breve]|uniref:Zinc-ribbon domain-containing protein n=1 Tax=Candidatus Promineifilum breve TaxID=1806508 RepID=A0A160T2M7_9CHLR|nr:zinc ribbon domain-containing protein [Candidatus Promineifilum breve]CUS03954.2 conserved protein of unknown function [Candidatus Promineifilum breve]